jgi:hypothetical protein
MELLEFPDRQTWEERNTWIENEIENSVVGSHLVSDQATALFIELQACYNIGAWLTVIILSVSIIDAHLRETEAMDNKIGTAKLLNDYYEGEDINWLRKLRNKYVHLDIDNPALEMNMQYGDRTDFKNDATKAIQMVIKAFFQNPGT